VKKISNFGTRTVRATKKGNESLSILSVLKGGTAASKKSSQAGERKRSLFKKKRRNLLGKHEALLDRQGGNFQNKGRGDQHSTFSQDKEIDCYES